MVLAQPAKPQPGFSMPECKATNSTTHFGFKTDVQCNVTWSSSYLFTGNTTTKGMICNYAKTWIQNAIAIFQIHCMLWTRDILSID